MQAEVNEVNKNVKTLNLISFPTFRFIKVNEGQYAFPQLTDCPYAYGKDLLADCEGAFTPEQAARFKGLVGLSEYCEEIIEEKGNFRRLFATKAGEERDFGLLTLTLNEDNAQLLCPLDIYAAPDSNLRLNVVFRSEDEHKFFRMERIRILAAARSHVEVFLLHLEGDGAECLSSIKVVTEDEADVKINQYELGGGQVFTNTEFNLLGQASHGNVNAVYFGRGTEQLDILYQINHYGKESESDVLVNGALAGQAFKRFRSTLDFKEGSSSSVGSEEEYVILLDDNMHALSVPVLLCHEEDVLGNHATSSGKIDNDLCYYLMTRGLSRIEAERLIVEARFTQAFDEVPEEYLRKDLRVFLHELMDKTQRFKLK